MTLCFIIWILAFVGFAVFALAPIWIRRGNGVDTCITCGDPIEEHDEGFCEQCYVLDRQDKYEEYMEEEAEEARKNKYYSPTLDGGSLLPVVSPPTTTAAVTANASFMHTATPVAYFPQHAQRDNSGSRGAYNGI